MKTLTPEITVAPVQPAHVKLNTDPVAVDKLGFLVNFPGSVHDVIKWGLTRPGVEGIVCFENRNAKSKQFGHRTAAIYGPQCAYQTLSMMLRGILGKAPDHRVPVCYYVNERRGKA